MRQIFLDTETTGLEHKYGHRIIEIGGVEMINRRLTRRHFHYYLNPERDIDAGALAVHGISLDFLQDKPRFADIAAEFLDFVRGAELIIHNAPFDVGFLDMEFKRMKLPPVSKTAAQITDTLKMAKERYPGQKNSLDALCTRLDVDRSRRVLHGALIDCELLADVYLAMTRSQFSLVDDMLGGGEQANAANPAASAHNHAQLNLKVLPANSAELAAHEAYLADLDKAAGADCAWRQWPQS